jgi:intracellular septation protein A
MEKINKLAKFVFKNFGPILVFYIANYFFGLKIAVVASIIWTVGEIIFSIIRKQPLSLFFKFSALITIIFGLIDLYLQQTLLFRFEAALSNIMIGIFFALSLWGEKPIIREFAEAQGRISSHLNSEDDYYFKFLTVIWSIYMFVKAGFYFWVATAYSLAEGLAIRATFGNATFYGLLAISIFGSKQIKAVLAKLRLLPSARIKTAD